LRPDGSIVGFLCPADIAEIEGRSGSVDFAPSRSGAAETTRKKT
jgi:hypothetical protein